MTFDTAAPAPGRHRAALLACALLCACSDSAVDADAFLEQYPEAYCAYVWRCCSGAERSFGSTSSCELAIRTRLDELLAFRGVNGTAAVFIESAAQGCLDKLAGACSSELAANGCLDGVTRAGHGIGEPCRFSAECETFNCNQDQKHAEGTCGSKAPAGGTCSGDDRGCDTGFCASSRMCDHQKSAGLPCARAAECESGICTPAPAKLCSNRSDPFCDG